MKPIVILIFLLSFTNTIWGQQYTLMAEMPEAVSNNAVAGLTIDNNKYVYSFCGIDASKIFSGIHLHTYKYDVNNNLWTTLEDIIDPLGGKIAAGASVVKDKIYIIGGYHVASNGSEVSSKKTHVFNPQTDLFEDDGEDVLTAIDDHVQCVWRDSLIYVITGWSNSGNVNKVQVYNPTENTWNYGTSTPNNNDYKVFGASGSIIGDTIYYLGGAKYSSNFPATTVLRKGIINPNNPLEITWEKMTDTNAKNYRAASFTYNDKVYWLGGSHVTYNFNGIAYNGSGGVLSHKKLITIGAGITSLSVINGAFPPLMDLRGIANFNDGSLFLAGGMVDPQEVTSNCYMLNLNEIVNTSNFQTYFANQINVYPNPTTGIINISPTFKGKYAIKLININGKIIFQQNNIQGHKKLTRIQQKGQFILKVEQNGKIYNKKIVVN